MDFLVEAEIDQDAKAFDEVQNIIRAGQLETLKVDQCKIYLRKHGLRLAGSKDTMIQRIQEHLDVAHGGGQRKYPKSSFVMNCKGDACTGDVVLFEQKVYNKFNLASRSANGPPLGKRIVAGRIVKESYGSAKQQHTFTIEVLWSKGKRPFPPLHPLLIKGRNLYRLRTMRQRWDDEEERKKALLEKHSRGSSARANRDERAKEKQTRKNLKAARVSRKVNTDAHQPSLNSMKSGHAFDAGHRQSNFQSYQMQPVLKGQRWDDEEERKKAFLEKHSRGSFARGNRDGRAKEKQTKKNSKAARVSRKVITDSQKPPLNSMKSGDASYAGHRQSNFWSYQMQPVKRSNFKENRSSKWSSPSKPLENVNHFPSIWKGHRQDHYLSSMTALYSRAGYESLDMIHYPPIDPVCGSGHKKPELCWDYTRGRCYYGDDLRYLH